MDINLRPNQINAITNFCDNDYHSGIHYHATGTGKSWIAMYLPKDFHLNLIQKVM